MANEPEEHRIFVGRLRDVDTEEFLSAFQIFGNIITWSFYPGRPFGFISYGRKVDAEDAIENMDGKYLGDRQIVVEWADGWPKDDDDDDEEEESDDDYDHVYNMACENNSTVHCKGLTCSTTKETLEDIFCSFGVIEEITLFNHHSDYAFIKFNSKEAATLAICEINNTEIDGSQVKCSWSYRPEYLNADSSDSSSISRHSSSSNLEFDDFDRIFNQTTPNNRTVYCGGLDDYVTTELIEATFSPFGIVESITLFNDTSDFGFIRFNTKEAAALAICSIDGTFINGCHVRCNWSHRAEGYSTERQQSSESSPELSLPSVSHLTGRVESVSTQSGLGIPGAAAASASLPAEKSEGAVSEKKTDMLCKICMDEELGVVFLPCGHLTSCAKCAQKIVSCPLCRRRITGKVRTYLS